MADFHRLAVPTYMGGLPGTHDYINDPPTNGDPGVPVVVDTGKLSASGHVNEGTYLVGFNEDATSFNVGRSSSAFGRNCDFLDNVVSGELAVPTHLDAAAGAPIATLAITDDVFVGLSGIYTDTQDWRDKLVTVLDQTTKNEVVDASGVRVKATLIHDGGSTNVVGVPASGFYTDPTFNFTPSIPTGTNFRIVYAKRGSLVSMVKSKTHLDALVRLAIRGSHEVAAEVVRFMTEASRRAGGQIQALCATTIETPGTGDNILGKADALTFDVDPSDDFGAGPRSLQMKVGGGDFFVVEEDAKGTSIARLATAKNDLQLRDARMDGANGPMALTTVTDHEVYRVLDVDWGTQPSLLEMINTTKWAVTVGDGTNTFGDFNGSTAIEDAIAWLHGNVGAGRPLHIFVKSGVYTFTSTYTIPSGRTVILEGPAPLPTASGSLTAGILNDTGANADETFTGSKSTTLIVRNCLFGRNDSADGEYFYDGLGHIILEDCEGYQCIKHTATGSYGHYAIQIRRCSLDAVTDSITQPLIWLNTFNTELADVDRVWVENCVLSSHDDFPVCRVTNAGVNANSEYKHILFDKCEISLGSTDDDGGGDLEGNSGAFEVVPGVNNNLSVRSVEWRDCYVTVGDAGKDAQILLYVRANNGANYITVDQLKIIGGRWEITEATTISPFYVGGAIAAALDAVEYVVVEGVEWGFTPSAQGPNGAPTTEVAGPATAAWAGFYIGAVRVKMRNVTWLSNTGLSNSGDLFIYGCRKLDILGLDLASNAWWAGSASAPEYRVKIVTNDFTQFGMFALRDALIGDPNTANATVGSLVLDRVAGAAQNFPSLVSNCSIPGNSESGGALIYLAGGSTGDEEGNGWHFEDCRLEASAGYGFFFDWSAVSLEEMSDIRISRCKVLDCDDGGIYFHFGAANKIGDVDISGCLVQDCVGTGLSVNGTAPWNTDSSGLTLRDNHFENNNGANSNAQIFVDEMDLSVGCAYGNSSAADAGVPGIWSVFTGPSDHFRGTETGYTYTGDGTGAAIDLIQHTVTTGEAATNERNHRGSAGHEMMHNRFRFIGP